MADPANTANFWQRFYRWSPDYRARFFVGAFAIKPFPGFQRRAEVLGYTFDMDKRVILHEDDVYAVHNRRPKEGVTMGHRSRDRVHFKAVNAYGTRLYADVAAATLGIIPKDWYAICAAEGVIVCRPSQFARFLIRRDEAGLKNGFKELEAQLVLQEPQPTRLDVSGNPA